MRLEQRLEISDVVHRSESCLRVDLSESRRDDDDVQGNDLCGFCKDLDKHDPANFTRYVRDTLDRLYQASLPRTLVNVVLVLDVRSVRQLNKGGLVCELLHKFLCPCAAFPTADQEKTLNEWVPQYQQNLLDLVASGRYDGREDFTVVVQPFLAQTPLPQKASGDIDFSYFAPDCFHFSGTSLAPLPSTSFLLSGHFRQRSFRGCLVLVEQHV